jgi:hypothetical protein
MLRLKAGIFAVEVERLERQHMHLVDLMSERK